MKRNAFTLVELLIVIAIMMILVTITVSQFQTAKKKANDVSRKGDLNGVSKALQMYFTDYGVFPNSTADGKIVVGTGAGATTLDWGDEFVDGGYVYMKVLPRENNSGFESYCYKTDTDRKKYALFAMLENTADRECEGHDYSCGGNSGYCFAYVSPNTVLNPDGSLQ